MWWVALIQRVSERMPPQHLVHRGNLPPSSGDLFNQYQPINNSIGRSIQFNSLSMKGIRRPMKMSTRTFLTVLVISAVLAAFTLPAAAHGFGPVLYCDTGTLQNCTDTTDAGTARDIFSCEGTAGAAASCTNRMSGETSPYCAFMGHLSGTDRDSYLCEPAPGEQPVEHNLKG